MKKNLAPKVLALILSAALAICAQTLPTSFWNGAVDVSWYHANPSAREYNITTAAQLAGLAELVNTGVNSFSGRTINLMANIVLNDTNFAGGWRNWDENTQGLRRWTPIGSGLNLSEPIIHDENVNGYQVFSFSGSFNGNGATISGLFCVQQMQTRQRWQGGLFGRVDGDSIQDLNVLGGFVIGERTLGMLTGGAYGILLQNIQVRGRVIGTDAGLLFGMGGGNLEVINVGANGFVGGRNYVYGNDRPISIGGLIGWATHRVDIRNSYVNAEVVGGRNVGGLIGTYYVDSEFGRLLTIQNTYAAGSVISDDYMQRGGGFLGAATITGHYDDEVGSNLNPMLFLTPESVNNAYNAERNPTLGAAFMSPAGADPRVRPLTNTQMRSFMFGTHIPPDPFNPPNPLDVSLNLASIAINGAWRWRLDGPEAERNDGFPVFDKRPINIEIEIPTFDDLIFGYTRNCPQPPLPNPLPCLPGALPIIFRNNSEIPVIIDWNNMTSSNSIVHFGNVVVYEYDNLGNRIESVFEIIAPPLASSVIGANTSIPFSIRPIRLGLNVGTYTASVQVRYIGNRTSAESQAVSIPIRVVRAHTSGELFAEVLVRDRYEGQRITAVRNNDLVNAMRPWQRFEIDEQNILCTKADINGALESGREHTIEFAGIGGTVLAPQPVAPTTAGTYMVTAHFPIITYLEDGGGRQVTYPATSATNTFTVWRNVHPPVIEDKVYTGEIIIAVTSNDEYTVLEDSTGINAGRYTAVLNLNNPLFERWNPFETWTDTIDYLLHIGVLRVTTSADGGNHSEIAPQVMTTSMFSQGGASVFPRFYDGGSFVSGFNRQSMSSLIQRHNIEIPNYAVSGGLVSIPWRILQATVNLPTVNAPLVYNSEVQVGVNEGAGFTLLNNTGTNAGTYQAIAILDDPQNFRWNDNNFETVRRINWEILRAPIAYPEANAPLVFDGTLKVGVDDGIGFTLTNHAAIPVGPYTATATLSQNHIWIDGKTDPFDIDWEILPAPKGQGLGTVHLDDWIEGLTPSVPVVTSPTHGIEGVTFLYLGISGTVYPESNVQPTLMGVYRITAIFPENEEYYEFRATNTFQILSPNTMLQGSGSIFAEGWTYGEEQKMPVVTSETNDASRAVITWTSHTTGTVYTNVTPTSPILNAGVYTITAVIPAARNHNVVTLTAQIEVLRALISAPIANTGLVYNAMLRIGVNEGFGFVLENNTGINAGTYTATARLADPRNYRWSVGEPDGIRNIIWEIARARPEFVVPRFYAYVGDSLSMFNLPVGWTWVAEGFTLVGDEGLRLHPGHFTPRDTINYHSIVADIEIVVSQHFVFDLFLAKNPVIDEWFMEFIVLCTDNADVNIKVLDVTGNKLLDTNVTVRRNEHRSVFWDMRNLDGRIIGSGSYLVIGEAVAAINGRRASLRLTAGKRKVR